MKGDQRQRKLKSSLQGFDTLKWVHCMLCTRERRNNGGRGRGRGCLKTEPL